MQDFAGNKDQNTIVYHKLKKPIIARFIRFVPMAWFAHISMRVELYGCSGIIYLNWFLVYFILYFSKGLPTLLSLVQMRTAGVEGGFV